jgi:hypothetical protein
LLVGSGDDFVAAESTPINDVAPLRCGKWSSGSVLTAGKEI